MKRWRVWILAAGVLALLASALHWSVRPSGYRTPSSCVEAYRDASLDGDVDRYLRCLAEPLRSQTRQRFRDEPEMAAALRAGMQDLKGWSQLVEQTDDNSVTHVMVDEVRATDTRRYRLRLTRSGPGWLIAGIEAPKLVPTDIPYGTHISKVAGESAQEKADERP